MSYEGYIQRWCSEGHYWETQSLFMVSEPQYQKDKFCSKCGGAQAAWCAVDNTNLDDQGRISVVDRLPSSDEFKVTKPLHTSMGNYWHKDILDDPEWLKAIEDVEDPKDRKQWYIWAGGGE